jgi:hypothetical protein
MDVLVVGDATHLFVAGDSAAIVGPLVALAVVD